jgi:hypothetical protein
VNQPKINKEALTAASDVTCEKCTGQFFDQAVALKKISALDPNNPTGQAQLIPMGIFVCRNCNTPILSID